MVAAVTVLPVLTPWGQGCRNPQLRGCVLCGWEIPGELQSLGRKWLGAPPSLGEPGVCSDGPAVRAWPRGPSGRQRAGGWWGWVSCGPAAAGSSHRPGRPQQASAREPLGRVQAGQSPALGQPTRGLLKAGCAHPGPWPLLLGLTFDFGWERPKAGGEGDDMGRDGSTASPTQWTSTQ